MQVRSIEKRCRWCYYGRQGEHRREVTEEEEKVNKGKEGR